jgi:hypothetical protein
MIGIHLLCSVCTFDMLTGWNHHRPGVTVICCDCGQQIGLLGQPRADEVCEVRLAIEDPQAPEGLEVGPIIGTAVIGGVIFDETYGLIPTVIELKCPSCGSDKAAGGLPAGSPCPRCTSGSIVHGGSAVY